MTPTDILAAARLSPLSPVVPAREEWLKDWIGPVVYDDAPAALMGPDNDYPGGQWCLSRPDGWEVMNDTTWCLCAEAGHIRLDLRRPEVRDRLVRCGAPAMCREDVARAMAWVLTGVGAIMLFLPVASDEEALSWLVGGTIVPCDDGWYIPLPGGAVGWLPKESA